MHHLTCLTVPIPCFVEEMLTPLLVIDDAGAVIGPLGSTNSHSHDGFYMPG